MDTYNDWFQPLINPLTDGTDYDLTNDEFPTMMLPAVEVAQGARSARRFRVPTGWLIFVLCWLPGLGVLVYKAVT